MLCDPDGARNHVFLGRRHSVGARIGLFLGHRGEVEARIPLFLGRGDEVEAGIRELLLPSTLEKNAFSGRFG